MGEKNISVFIKKISFCKGIAFALALTLVFLSLASCSRKNSGEETGESEGSEALIEETFVKIESKSSTIESVMLGGSLWRENEGGYMEWVRDLPAGTAVGAYRNQDSAETFPAEIKRNALRTSDWSRRNFIHVLYNSADYWVQEIFLVLNAKPGLVIDGGSFLYGSADDASSAGRWVSEGVEVAVLNSAFDSESQPKAESASKMVEVSVYLRDYGLIPNRFMLAEKITTNADDITAMHILSKLGQRGGNGMLLIQDGTVRRELKDVASRLDISDTVRAKIKNY